MNHNQQDYEGYLWKIAILFPVGRWFASFKQLTQACGMFLETWAVVKVHLQKKIWCFYGMSTKGGILGPANSWLSTNKFSITQYMYLHILMYILNKFYSKIIHNLVDCTSRTCAKTQMHFLKHSTPENNVWTARHI
jgi:hypothetical protein